jgi:hypothetical protein
LNNGVRLDLITEVKGLENITFADCLKEASIADINQVSVPFLHIDHLIESKKAANRTKGPASCESRKNQKNSGGRTISIFLLIPVLQLVFLFVLCNTYLCRKFKSWLCGQI